MRVLLTSPRAPVTLDLARRFNAQSADVYLCDSLRYGCGALSRNHRRMFNVPRPRQSVREYLVALQTIVKVEKIDLLVPTCEEIFYISKFRDQIGCEVFADSFDKLGAIHNKWSFAKEAGNVAASVPESHEITSHEQLLSFQDRSREYVFKPVYSRFASEVLIAPEPNQLVNLSVSNNKRWIAQRFVSGTEFSTYSIARNGKMLAHASYTSIYRAGHGSGIYFRAETHPRIDEFVRTFISEYGFTGQIGFDCIVDETNVPWIIEGNPRATSGLHMLEFDAPLLNAILGNTDQLIEANTSRPRMIAAAMPLWGLAYAFKQQLLRQYVGDFWRGRDVLFQWKDPMPAIGLPLTLAELLLIAVRERKTMQQASTQDIEWNGEPL